MAGDGRTPFRVLWRTFVDQFFTGQSGTTDAQLHQAYVWIAVFLLTPGVFLLIQLFPDFQAAVILGRLGRVPPTLVDDYLAWIALFLTTYSMAAVGFLAVLSWDTLSFDRRDAMVLGSLPVSSTTLILAKLTALGTLLLTVSVSIAVINSVMFALITSDQLGLAVFVRHLISMFVSTFGSGLFIFASIVFLRSAVLLVGGSPAAEACGPVLQFVCVVVVLCLMFLSPAVWQVSYVSAEMTGWMPPAWFVGVFESLRHSPRANDPAFPFLTYEHRAVVGSLVAVTGALLLTVAEFGRQMRATIVPVASPGWLGRAVFGRFVARVASGQDRTVRAISEFALTTLARNRRQQLPVALNAAAGAAVIIIGLSRDATSLDALLRPRTAVLWIPLVMGYWLAAGVRASFFVPSELAASWTFRFHPVGTGAEQWRAARASMLGFVLPRVLLLCLGLVPAVGWAVASWHMAVASGVTMIVTAVMALGAGHVPFTRAFEPGHSRLRTRWAFYALGMYVCAYWPARIEVSRIAAHRGLDVVAAVILVVALVTEIVLRHLPMHLPEDIEDGEDAQTGISVLDLAGAHPRA